MYSINDSTLYFRYSYAGDGSLNFPTTVYFSENVSAVDFDIDGSFQYEDGNESAGKVLTSDASGNASWQAATQDVTTLFTDVVDHSTVSNLWETLSTYDMPANTLATDGTSLEIVVAHYGTVSADSIKFTIGGENVYIASNGAVNTDNLQTTVVELSSLNQLSMTGTKFQNTSFDETAIQTINIECKSVTGTNQSVKYVKIQSIAP